MKKNGLKVKLLKKVRSKIYILKVKIYDTNMYKLVSEIGMLQNIPQVIHFVDKDEAIEILRKVRLDSARVLFEGKGRKRSDEVKLKV